MTMPTIRAASHIDVARIAEIGAVLHAESPRFSRLNLSTPKLMQLFLMLIESPDGLLLVADRAGAVVGGMAGVVTPHWFSDDLVSNDYGVFLLPDQRGGMTAARLVRGYIEWAKAKGAKMIQLGISTGVQTEETVSLYRALGLKQFSVGFEG
ncbi:GNAT family N-acetyltransferase [Sulfuritalea hydrogenivorans]|uniref:N-acetyltransferase domain-containing protein n=1 Tax=Sulfuritalea hydrogenivorans sk43H TaxID=1223802 RepID=W0SF56_9PROT|nr:GNAT family N-acetyltransferase [Sulfuritalea hydrogenivorans]BAO29380.1 hypothetical protein SUTH_01587 [Sulfuritalea hydrogenivorans sk43H]